MSKISVPPSRKAAAQRLGQPSEEHPIANAILRNLPNGERENLISTMTLVDLPSGLVLNEVAQSIQAVYFVEGGLVSIVNVLPNEKSVEVGLTGKEGFVGLPLAVGFETSPTRAITQISGTAFRMGAANFRTILGNCPKLEKNLQRYAQELALQSTQLAACNRLHEVEERLARWLLMSQDRVGGNRIELTQESLSNMLGTRRASVTIAAGILQDAGLISYKRGLVKIENRTGLESASCQCYAIMNQQLKRWHVDSA